MTRKLVQFSFASALLLVVAGALAAMPTESDKPLGFGTADIPELIRKPVNQTSPRTVQLIIDAIQSARGSRRVELVADLGKCKRAEALQTLYSLLKDPASDVRAEAAHSIAEIGDKSSIVNLEALFADADASVRREGIIAAAALGDLNASKRGLADADVVVKQTACAHPVMPASIAILSDALESLPIPARIAALESLSTEDASAHWKTVASCLKGSTSERYAALRTLAAMKVAASASAILPMLQASNGIVRREAVVALAQTASVRERQQMAVAMLADSDLTVRDAAAEVIAGNPTDAATPLLVEQLSQGNQPLRQSAREALVAIGSTSIPAAGKLLIDPDNQRQEDGSYILGKLHSRDYLQNHIALLKSSDWVVVAQAARSLDLIGDASAGPALAAVVGRYAQLENDKSPEADDGFDAVATSILAAAHLGYSALLPATDPLIAKMDCQPSVRQAAIYAFGILGNASDLKTCGQLLSIADNADEVVSTRLEAVKALGCLRVKSAESLLATMDASEANLQLRWVAHWAHERISGQKFEFPLPPLNWSADVSIIDLGGDITSEQQLSGTIGFQASYLAEAWVPVHLMFRNGTAQPVNGSVSFAVGNGSESATVRAPCVVPAESAVKLNAYGYFPDKPIAGQSGAAMVDWSDNEGRRIARTPIMANAFSARDGFGAQSNNSLDTVVLCLNDSDGEYTGRGRDERNASNFASAIAERVGFGIKAQLLPIQEAPDHPAGYDSCRIVLLNADPDRLNMAQRAALLDHLRSGGELLLCGTRVAASSWLWQYEPVLTLSTREISGIVNAKHGDSIRFAQPASIVEAVDAASADTIVAARDSQLIHVAFRPIGLGCVVFTSFPVNALDVSDDRAVQLWKEILELTVRPNRTLTMASAPTLGELVGVPTQPISVPIALIAGYVATVLLSQRFFSGASRPWAYAVTVGVGVIGFACLGATSLLHSPGHELSGARITALSLGPDGGGRQEDLFAFAGTENSSFGFTADQDATVRPIASSEREAVQIEELPFAVRRAGVHPMEVKQIWAAQRALDSSVRVKATAKFGPAGLTMNVDNGFDQPLRHPMLVWAAPWALPEIGAGGSDFSPLERSMRGDYAGASGLRSDVDAVRSKIISNVLSTGGVLFDQHPRGPLLLGWIDHFPSVVQIGDAKLNSQNLLRVPVAVMPSVVGSTVTIDGSFCRIVPGPGAGAPYDSARQQWIPRNQPGDWIIGFAPPKEIGILRPMRVTLNADVSAPTQTITLMHGICEWGKLSASLPGAVLCQWKQSISTQSADFECGSNDFDSSGCVWIRLRVESSSPSPSAWFFRSLEMSYVANVIANPTAQAHIKE